MSRSTFMRSISASALALCRTANFSYESAFAAAAGDADTAAALLGTVLTPAVATMGRDRCAAVVGVAFTMARIGVAVAAYADGYGAAITAANRVADDAADGTTDALVTRVDEAGDNADWATDAAAIGLCGDGVDLAKRLMGAATTAAVLCSVLTVTPGWAWLDALVGVVLEE